MLQGKPSKYALTEARQRNVKAKINLQPTQMQIAGDRINSGHLPISALKRDTDVTLEQVSYSSSSLELVIKWCELSS